MKKKTERSIIIVPRTSTGTFFASKKASPKNVPLIGALAEKAKVWQDKLGKGTRQTSPVT